MNSRLLSLAVVSLAGLLHGCGDSDPTPSTTAVADCPAQIEVKDNEFVPKTCKVKAGTKVEWVWKGAMEHDVVSGAKSGSRCTKDTKFPSSTLLTTGTYSHTFSAAGDYPYFCTPHCAVDMTGTIKVE
jgi:plastocyanin